MVEDVAESEVQAAGRDSFFLGGGSNLKKRDRTAGPT